MLKNIFLVQKYYAIYGSTAYNFYIKGTKYPEEPVLNYEVYTNEDRILFRIT